MRKRTGRWLWLVTTAIGMTVAVGIGLLGFGTGRPSQALPDGSLLTLEAVTYGKQHRYIHGKWWQKALYPVLPSSIKAQLPVDSVTSDSPDTLVFWTLRREAVTGRPLAQPFWRPHVFSVDDQGRVAETGDLCFRSEWKDAPPVEMLEGWKLPAFPRRGRTVGLLIETRDGAGRWTRAAEFKVPNPTPGPYPTWTPEPLPITRRDGDLTVTLTQFSTGARKDDPRRAAGPDEESWTHTTCRFAQEGHPDSIWQNAGFVMTDATGNTCQSTHDLFHKPLPGGEQFSFLGSLWPGESAWKLRFHFIRKAGFTADELWRVPDLPVPGPRQVIHIERSARRQGALIRVLSICGREDFRSRTSHSGVQVRFSPGADNLRLSLVHAIDDRGRDVTPGFASLGNDGTLSYGLVGAADHSHVSLTFAVQRPRTVEFLVKPQVP